MRCSLKVQKKHENTYHIVDITGPEIWLQAVIDNCTLKNAQNPNRIGFFELMVDI